MPSNLAPAVSPADYVIYDALGSLSHQVGRAEGDGWSANTQQDHAGYLSFGPYTTTVPAGTHTASFRLLVDNNSYDDAPVATLDVYSPLTGEELAERVIRRGEFASPFAYQDFGLAFGTDAGRMLEFRVFYDGNSYLRESQVAIAADQGLVNDPQSLSVRYQAESDLQHLVGRTDGDGWSANTQQDHAGYLSFGPYTTTVPAGTHTAFFRLLVDNNNYDDAGVATLDVYSPLTGEELAERVIRRGEFASPFAYQDFGLAFGTDAGRMLEFRIFYDGNSYLRQDFVQVTSPPVFGAVVSLGHQVGRAEGDGWSANTQQDHAGYLSFGPYTTAVPAGTHTASFRLLVDNNSYDDAPVATLDVYSPLTGEELAQRVIRRGEFASPFTYQDFDLAFGTDAGRMLEFRLFYNGNSYLRQDSVVVTKVTTLNPADFQQQIGWIDSVQPMPASGFVFDWTKYSGSSSGPHAEDAVFEITAFYQGKPGTDALSFPTLPPGAVDALPELRGRVDTRLAVLDTEITDLAGIFGSQQNTDAGVVTYGTLRGKLVEQATLQLLNLDLKKLQAGRDEEAERTQSARALGLYSLPPTPAPASDTAPLDQQLAAVRAQEEVVVSNLGSLAVAQQTEQDIASAAKFQTTSLEATVAAQEIQTAFDTTRTGLTALQTEEAGLQDQIDHPLDHLAWPPVSGVDFAVGRIAGTFGALSLPPDNKTIITGQSAAKLVEVRDAVSGAVDSSFTTADTLNSVIPTADGQMWTQERASYYQYVRLIDPKTGQKLWEWQSDTSLNGMAGSADGSLIAVSSYKTVTLIRRSGALVTRQDIVFTDNLQSDMHFSPDGNFLAVPMQSSLVLLNVNTGDMYQFAGFRDTVNATAWSDDGTMVAAGDRNGFVQIIDVPTKQKIGSFQMPTNNYVGSLAFSPNQALLVTGDQNVGLMFWDITHLDQIHEYARSTGEKDLYSFQKSNTGNTLLALNSSGIIAYAMPQAGRGAPISRATPPILDPVQPTPPPSPDHPSWTQSGKVNGTLGTVLSQPFTSITPDGQTFVIPDGGQVQLRSIATGQVTQTYNLGGNIFFAAFSSNGQKMILVDSVNPSTLKTMDVTTGAVSLIQSFPANIEGAAFNSGHNLVAVADQAGGSRVKVIDLTTDATEEIPGTENHSEAVAISESGQYVAVGLMDGGVVVYDRTTRQSHTLTGLHLKIKVLSWSHGSDALLAAADNNAHLALFAPSSSQALSVFSSPYDSDPTTGLQFSANNLLLIRGASANGLLTFDVSNPGSPTVSSEVPLLALNGAGPFVLSATGGTLFASAVDSGGRAFITGVTVPAYGRTPVSSSGTPPPAVPPPSVPPLNSAQQNELAAPTTIATFNATQQQYLLDSVTAYFSERVKENGDAGVPSFYLDTMESNPDLFGLNSASPYPDFYVQLVKGMQVKWPLQNPPQLDPYAGGSGSYIAPANPVPPPPISPVQIQQRQIAEQLLQSNLASPLPSSAAQWETIGLATAGLGIGGSELVNDNPSTSALLARAKIAGTISPEAQAAADAQTATGQRTLYNSAFSWYNPATSPLRTYFTVRSDTIVGRIMQGAADRLWQAQTPYAVWFESFSVQRLTDIPASKVVAERMAANSAQDFAQRLMNLLGTAQYGDLFFSPGGSQVSGLLIAHPDQATYTSGEVRIRFDATLDLKDFSRVDVYLWGKLVQQTGAAAYVRVPLRELQRVLQASRLNVVLTLRLHTRSGQEYSIQSDPFNFAPSSVNLGPDEFLHLSTNPDPDQAQLEDKVMTTLIEHFFFEKPSYVAS
ncbi:MAG: WD40 repeat domain-containing protein, partial [Planctomycetes bacterium]|nr:WD40 repeat domain-containing protein [Planctomycetota bacterium]